MDIGAHSCVFVFCMLTFDFCFRFRKEAYLQKADFEIRLVELLILLLLVVLVVVLLLLLALLLLLVLLLLLLLHTRSLFLVNLFSVIFVVVVVVAVVVGVSPLDIVNGIDIDLPIDNRLLEQ